MEHKSIGLSVFWETEILSFCLHATTLLHYRGVAGQSRHKMLQGMFRLWKRSILVAFIAIA